MVTVDSTKDKWYRNIEVDKQRMQVDSLMDAETSQT
jgi:hypothetical protein